MSNAFGTQLESGPVQAIDPLALEPGLILFDRFCVLESARVTSAGGWEIAATDVKRQLGGAPHHRVNLIFLPASTDLGKVRTALDIEPTRQTQPLASIPVVDGLVVVAPPRVPPPSSRLQRDAWLALALDLSNLLSLFHRNSVVGVHFDASNVFFDGHHASVYGYGHLLPTGTVERDVTLLLDLLAEKTDEDLPSVMRPRPTTAAELWERCRALGVPVTHQAPATLPAVPPFVGRQDILDNLTRRCDAARRGQSSIVVIEAMGGAGKSRLLQQLAVVLDRWMDTLIVSGSFQAGVPFHRTGFVEALTEVTRVERTLPQTDRDLLRERLLDGIGPLAGVVTTLAPELTAYLGLQPTPPSLESDKQFLRHASTVAAAVRAVGTAKRPLVVVLDNAHLADAASIEVLRNLSEEKRAHHTVVVLAGWTGMSPAILKAATDHHALGPLSVTEVADLIRGAIPGKVRDPLEDARRLRQITEGWPLQTWVTLQSWVEQGRFAPDPRDQEWSLLNHTLETAELVQLYRRQFHRLKPHELWVAVVVALRPGRVAASWIEGVMNWGPSEVDRAIVGVAKATLLVLEPGGTVRFPHDSVREFILETVSPDVVARAHQQIAAWLKQHETDEALPQYTWHLEHATLPGPSDDLATNHLQSGNALLAVYDLDRAEWHFRRAMARATDAAVILSAREGLAHVDLLAGRVTTALRVYQEVIRASNEPVRSLQIAARAAHGLYRKSSVEAAIELSAEALDRAGEPLPKGRFGLWMAIALALLRLMVPLNRTPAPLRDAFCQLYVALIAAAPSRPDLLLLAILRGTRHAWTLRTPSSSVMLSFYAAFRAATGGTRAARGALAAAHGIATETNDRLALGVHAHITGQNDLAEGRWDSGMAALGEAVSHLQTAGDDSTAVLSLVYRAVYGRNRQPTDDILEMLREAEAASIRAATTLWRDTIGALRLLMRARRGDDVAADVRGLAAALDDHTAGPSITATRMYVGLALSTIGDHAGARSQARHLATALASVPGQLEVIVEAHVAILEALLTPSRREPSDDKQIRRSLRTLRHWGGTSPRLHAAWLFYDGRRALGRGDERRAIDRFSTLIQTVAIHQDQFLTMRAHLLLADHWVGSEAERAVQHDGRAQQIARRLGLRTDHLPELAIDSPAETSHRDERPEPTGVVEVPPMVERLLPALEHALPAQIRFHADLEAGVQAACVAEQLQLLVVNLVLAARDALTGSGQIELGVHRVQPDDDRIIKLPLAEGRAYVLVEVRGTGYHASESISGLGVCCEITAGMGGFMNVGDDGPDVLVLSAFVPATDGPRSVVAASDALYAELVHPDPRIRSTLVSALQQLGYRVSERAELADVRGTPTDLLFVDQALLDDADATPRPTVRLVPRGARSTRGSAGPTLRVPFAMGELSAVLEQVGRGSSDTASPTA